MSHPLWLCVRHTQWSQNQGSEVGRTQGNDGVYYSLPRYYDIIVTEALYPEAVTIFSANLFRRLHLHHIPLGLSWTQRKMNPLWKPPGHISSSNTSFFLCFIESADYYWNNQDVHWPEICFCSVWQWESLRTDFLKTILHQIYGKFWSLWAYIPRHINHIFYRFI